MRVMGLEADVVGEVVLRRWSSSGRSVIGKMTSVGCLGRVRWMIRTESSARRGRGSATRCERDVDDLGSTTISVELEQDGRRKGKRKGGREQYL
jgi:hypothetical protein